MNKIIEYVMAVSIVIKDPFFDLDFIFFNRSAHYIFKLLSMN
ncbi:hypothetical protein RWY47_06925 [Paraclostridium sp. MRS3W1]|nr:MULTISPECIES: hypothetical protein [Paraclostridium]MDU0296602.1 hypothetical protein [Paraclostridium sp. MRS3W1]